MTDDAADRSAEDLREEQAEKARDERKHAEDAPDDDEAAAHDRRADKAAYLAARLAERERSERETGKQESE